MRAILDSFLAHLDEVERNVGLVETLRALGAASAPRSALRGPLGRAAGVARRTIRAQRTWETIALDGSLLYLCAQYEVAVRDLIEELVRLTCQKVAAYPDLPGDLRADNTRLIGELLRRGGENPRDPTVDHVQVLKDLVQCHEVGAPVRLYFQGFSYHDRNLSPIVLKDLMGRAGVSDLWPHVAQDQHLQDCLESVGENATEAAAKSKLSQFISDRNAISHRGPSYQTVGPSVILDYVRFFRCLMPALVGALESHLAEFGPRRAVRQRKKATRVASS